MYPLKSKKREVLLVAISKEDEGSPQARSSIDLQEGWLLVS